MVRVFVVGETPPNIWRTKRNHSIPRERVSLPLPVATSPLLLSVFSSTRRCLAGQRLTILSAFLLLLSCLLFSSLAALLVRVLLIRGGGGVHPNPGPSYPCTICKKSTWRGRSGSCCRCDAWTHLRCAGIRERDWSPTWLCPPCSSSALPQPSPPYSPPLHVQVSPPTLPPQPIPSTPPLQRNSPPPQFSPSGRSASPSPPPLIGAAPSVLANLDLGPILQWNCNGIRNSRLELLQFLKSHKIAVCALQETKLSPNSTDPSFPGYALIRRDRPGGGAGGGLAFLVHENIPFLPVNSDHLFRDDPITEHLSISVSLGPHPLQIYNIYIPPPTSCPNNFSPSVRPLLSLDSDTLILGDFNSHHLAWCSETQDDRAAARGTLIVEELDSSSLCLLNTDQHTRRPSNGNSSSPDLSFISAHLAAEASWLPTCALNSDHLPILIELGPPTSVNVPGPMYSNYKKADWEGFRCETEAAFENTQAPVSCSLGEHTFRSILQRAAGHHIPRGRRNVHIPGLSDEAKDLIRERDTLRSGRHDDPALPDLERRVADAISSSARNTWINTVESTSHRHNPSRFWSLLKSLSGKSGRQSKNQPIRFIRRTSHTVSKKRDVAEGFCQQFTSATNSCRPRDRRRIFRSIRKRPLDRTALFFTSEEVRSALDKSGNSTASGPDHLNILHLRNLGPSGISYLCSLFNLSINNADIPSIWKTAIIIPLLKPGKPAGDGSSYRPISLLCPAIKVLERLLLPELNSHLTVDESQHGFRPGRSTTTALLPLSQTIATGFNQRRPPHRTVALAVDFSKAFDTVPHHLLLSHISTSTLPNNHVRWLSSYLQGRSAYCLYNSVSSRQRPIRAGVPQGSVISPCLFNFFVASYPHTAPLHVSYADDFTAIASDSNVLTAAALISSHADDVATWANDHGLTISLSKSHSTLFTPDTHQSHLDPSISLEQALIPLNRKPKILGVTLDTHFTFSPHIKAIAEKARSRLNILRALAGSVWGQQKETLVLTYKSLIKSLFLYAAPVWFPNAADTGIAKLQVIQNAALRIATGSSRMSSIDHLHQETLMLPIKDSISLICSQFLARTLQPHHPSHLVVTSNPGPRPMKHTLFSRFSPQVSPYLEDGILPPDSYSFVIKDLHSSAVSAAVESQSANRVLQDAPPPISPEELSLPRMHRTALSQLRSGHCPSLNSYRHRVGWEPSAACPECNFPDHSVSHIFSCPTHPTTLSPLDLWTCPREVAAFLTSLPFFGHLCLLPPPPPEPPPDD